MQHGRRIGRRAAETRLRTHTTTLASEYARQGKRWDVELRQRAAELELMRELGLPIDLGGSSASQQAPQDVQAADGYPAPQGARDEARRGLEWRAEYGRGGTAVGVARARDIANGRALSLDTVQRMASYFARHEVDKQGEGWSPGEQGYPSAGRIAWALWGGDAGRRFAETVLDREEARQEA